MRTPVSKGLPRVTKAAEKCLESLAEFLLEHDENEIGVHRGGLVDGGGSARVLLTEAFPRSPWVRNRTKRVQPDGTSLIDGFPLHDVWTQRIDSRPAWFRDDDDLELIRVRALLNGWHGRWGRRLPKAFSVRNA
ncbi:MAG: hypothetical protein AAFO89_06850 [Planctomycetota bacterium]